MTGPDFVSKHLDNTVPEERRSGGEPLTGAETPITGSLTTLLAGIV